MAAASVASPSAQRRLTPDDFTMGDLLGEGAYAKVCPRFTHRSQTTPKSSMGAAFYFLFCSLRHFVPSPPFLRIR
jgi:hypothetical protein